MKQVRGEIVQRAQYEGALRHTGVGELEPRSLDTERIVEQDIDIDEARGKALRAAATPERMFELEDCVEQRERLQLAVQADDRVEIAGLSGIGPRLAEVD
jgi:hypothetical protein